MSTKRTIPHQIVNWVVEFLPDSTFTIVSSKAFRDASKVFFANGLATAISIVGIFVIQKIVAVRELGTFAVFNNLFTLTTGVILGGITTIFIRYLSQYLDHDLGIAKFLAIRTLQILLFISGGVFVVLTLFASQINGAFFHKPELTPYIQLVGISALTSIISSYYQTIFQAQQRFSLYATLILTQAVLGTLGVIGLATLHVLTPISVILFNVGVNVVYLFIGFLFYRKSTIAHATTVTPPSHLIREIIAFSRWIIVMSVTSFVFLKLDIFMLARVVPLEDIALYSFANSIYLAFILVLSAINTILLPRISRLKTPEEFHHSAHQITQLSLIVALLMIPAFFLVKPLVVLVFHDKFLHSMPILYVMFIGYVVSLILNPVVNLLIVLKQERFMAFSTVLMLVLNIIGNLVLIPRYGNMGAVSATTGSIIISNLILYLRLRFELRQLVPSITPTTP